MSAKALTRSSYAKVRHTIEQGLLRIGSKLQFHSMGSEPGSVLLIPKSAAKRNGGKIPRRKRGIHGRMKLVSASSLSERIQTMVNAAFAAHAEKVRAQKVLKLPYVESLGSLPHRDSGKWCRNCDQTKFVDTQVRTGAGSTVRNVVRCSNCGQLHKPS